MSFAHADQADLHIAIGSSLRVSPANEMPLMTSQKGGKLVIIK
jgi:NAD-dependent histone deacetylase SIR2